MSLRVLFTSPIIENPAAGGPQLRIENSIKALSRVCELHVVSRASKAEMGGDAAERFYRNLCRSFSYAPSAPRRSGPRLVRLLGKVANRLYGRDARNDARFLLNEVDRLGVDVVWFGFGNISYALIRRMRLARPDLKLVCDTDSVWSRFILREVPYLADGRRKARIERQGRRKEREERSWVALCDVTTAVSEVDAAYYRSISARPEVVHVFSNVLDLASYRAKPDAPADFVKPCIYLAGTFGHFHSPMDVAARWVIEEILPKVRHDFPDIHFYLVGRGSHVCFGDIRDPAITVTGKLPSVLPYLCHADVALVPLKFESGTRFKILEAAACDVPIVSTTLGAEGIPVRDGVDLLIADEAGTFADAIVRLLQDQALGAALARNANQLVREAYSVEQLAREATAILDALARQDRPAS